MATCLLDAGVGGAHQAVEVSGLLHGLRVVCPLQFGDRHEAGPQRVDRILLAQIRLGDVGHMLARDALGKQGTARVSKE